MDDEDRVTKSSGKRSSFVWLLVLLAVALIWWFWKPPADNGRAASADDQAIAAIEGDPDDILVDLSDDVDDGVIRDLNARHGIDLQLVSQQSKDERFYRTHVDPARRDEILAALAKDGRVEVAEPDAMYTLIDPAGGQLEPAMPPAEDPSWEGYPNDPQYKYQWHMRQIGMPQGWKLANGDGVIVAVIDTGVAYEEHGKKFHQVPDLAKTKFTKGYNFVSDGPHANDDHGHGTHVAGTIAQSTHNGVGVTGIAPAATIMPLKVLSARGSGSVAGIADAIHYAADNGAKVINMSLGGRMRSKVLEKAVKYAHDKGVVVVCAAGNDGSGKVSYPAAYPGAVAVAATQFDEATTFYSNWGKEIDIAAPGGNTQVDQNKDGMPDGVLQNTIVVGDPTRDGYFGFMGTSMAAPHIAGVAALVVGQGITDPDKVEQILKDTARAPHGRKLDPARYGAGIVDANAAIRKAKSSHGGSTQLALGLLIAGAAALTARRRLASMVTPASVGALVVGASGLWFLSFLGPLSRGFPSWDMTLLGAAGHGNVLFFSALVPVLAIGLAYGVAKLRLPLAAFAAGVAAHLLFQAAAGATDIRWMAFDQLWLAGNALLCIILSVLVLRK